MTARNPRAVSLAAGNKILKRLAKFYFCDASDPKNAKLIMTSDQVKAANVALRKYIPDLKCIEFVGDPDKPLITQIQRVIVNAAPDSDGAGIPATADTEPV